jgi:hypothetical protein
VSTEPEIKAAVLSCVLGYQNEAAKLLVRRAVHDAKSAGTVAHVAFKVYNWPSQRASQRKRARHEKQQERRFNARTIATPLMTLAGQVGREHIRTDQVMLKADVLTVEEIRSEHLKRMHSRQTLKVDFLEEVFGHIEQRLIALELVGNHKARQQQRWLARWQHKVVAELDRRKQEAAA